ncbi:MAG: hypothetical protein A3F13_05865 [Gammaproteobacteria bacterium RIFCSPHIGHO2_12_FULL_40_19]|nr:MAG: hypothetical protein A3F13_05865 [Gammaproteobacteria bacterium RIFCSPHIGHO2_12_FULL_40_19]
MSRSSSPASPSVATAPGTPTHPQQGVVDKSLFLTQLKDLNEQYEKLSTFKGYVPERKKTYQIDPRDLKRLRAEIIDYELSVFGDPTVSENLYHTLKTKLTDAQRSIEAYVNQLRQQDSLAKGTVGIFTPPPSSAPSPSVPSISGHQDPNAKCAP